MECFRPSREASTQKYADSSTGLGKVTFSLGSTAMARWMAWIALALPDHPLINIAELIQLSSCKQTKKKNNLQKNLRATPLETSQLSMLSARLSASSDPSKTSPNPPINILGIFYLIVNILTLYIPFITSPHPTPPPLWSETQVAPRKESPMQFWTAMSALIKVFQWNCPVKSSKWLTTCSEGRSVVNVGRLAERAVRPADVVVIATQHDVVRHFPLCKKNQNVKDTKSLWKKLIASTSDGSIESQGNGDSSPLIRVQDPGLRSDYQTVLARLFDPLDVIAVLNGDVVR